MALGFLRKRPLEPAAPAVEPMPAAPAPAPPGSAASDSDSAKAILELLELELGAMTRQLERAANSVAGGAEATAATLATIRRRTDALTGRTSPAQSTATTFRKPQKNSPNRRKASGPRCATPASWPIRPA